MKEKNLYLKSGYLNMKAIRHIDVPFIFVVGGRGTGKTYGIIKDMIESKEKFILMRRTQTQADLISKAEFSPVKSVMDDMFRHFKTVPLSKQSTGLVETDADGNALNGDIFCYTIALSTISNLRGFDASDVNYLFYDEFIPEPHEKPLKNEASAFYNCYETINRNRELKGRKPLKVIAAANANNMANPLFISMGLVTKVESMIRKGQSIWEDKERGIAVIVCQETPISKEKENTALYRLVDEREDFYHMSLKNSFTSDNRDRIGSMKLVEYLPVVHIGELYIYRHKSRKEYYVSAIKSGTFKENFTMNDMDKLRFRTGYRRIWAAFINQQVIFESYLIQVLFTKCFT